MSSASTSQRWIMTSALPDIAPYLSGVVREAMGCIRA
jgi:hypothetical protein